MFIVYATLSPIGLRPAIGNPNAERFFAFFVAGLLFCLAYPRKSLWVASFVIVAAVSLEFLQHITLDRHGRFSDAIVKVIGCVFGVATGALTQRMIDSADTRKH